MELSTLIPAPYRWLAWLIAAAAVAIVGFTAGVKITSAHYRPKLEQAQQQIGEYRNAYSTLAAATGRQNDAIAQLETAANARQAQAAQAVRQANAAAAPLRSQAAAIVSLKPPAGADECKAAQEAFDDELRAERGK